MGIRLGHLNFRTVLPEPALPGRICSPMGNSWSFIRDGGRGFLHFLRRVLSQGICPWGWLVTISLAGSGLELGDSLCRF